MNEYDVQRWRYEGIIADLKANLQILRSKISGLIAPGFYGSNLTHEALETMMQAIPKSDQLTVFVPSANIYIKMAFGDGTNDDSLSEGCDNYIMYTTFNSDFEEEDGGMMEFNDYRRHYLGDIRRAVPDVVDMVCGHSEEGIIPNFIPLTTNYQI